MTKLVTICAGLDKVPATAAEYDRAVDARLTAQNPFPDSHFNVTSATSCQPPPIVNERPRPSSTCRSVSDWPWRTCRTPPW